MAITTTKKAAEIAKPSLTEDVSMKIKSVRNVHGNKPFAKEHHDIIVKYVMEDAANGDIETDLKGKALEAAIRAQTAKA